MMAQQQTAFEEELEVQTKVKNIPNTEFTPDEFTFTDYFDRGRFREAMGGVDDMDDWVDWAFEPFEMYLSGVEEVSKERFEEDGMSWFGVTIELPDDPERQRLLAHLVADAWEQRQDR